MYPKAANFFVYLVASWILSGRFGYALVLAGVVAALAALEYGWSTIQLLGVLMVVAAFLRISGLLPFWPV